LAKRYTALLGLQPAMNSRFKLGKKQIRLFALLVQVKEADD